MHALARSCRAVPARLPRPVLPGAPHAAAASSGPRRRAAPAPPKPARPSPPPFAAISARPTLRAADPVERLREAIEHAKAAPFRVGADLVWDAYRALGSAAGLTADDVREAALQICARPVGEFGTVQRGPGEKAKAQSRAGPLVAEAGRRMRRLLTDAAESGIVVDKKTAMWFIQANEKQLVSYAVCRNLMDFLRSDCRVAFDVRHLNTLVTTVAHGGNYTAFLKLLHDCRTADAISAMDVYTVRLFLKAIAKAAANPAACEDLEGYPSRKTSVADLDTRAARDPLESEPEPEAALRAAILNGPEVQASDLYAPGMPPGSTTPVRKVIQLLSFVAARLEGRHADLVNNHITTGVIEAFLNAGHPRLARASVEVLAGEPFRIAPDAAHFNFLLKDAVERGDDRAADRLVWRWREAGVRPDRQLFNTTIGFYARAGRVDEARETLKEMKAAGIAPDELTGSHLLDGILAPGITVKDVELSLGWLAVNGIEITPKHQIKALRHFAELGDLDSMERIFADLPATPNSHAVATCAVAYAKHVDDERMFAFLGGVKKVQLPRSETWSAAIRALARRWAKTGDGEVGDLIFALINGVFDRKPVDPAAVSQGNRDFVLLGSEPPRPFPEFLQGIFSIARNSFTGDRLRILEEKGRAHLASEGYKVTPDMGAAEMLEAVERHPRLRGQSGSASD